MGPKTTAALVQVGVYLALTGAGFTGYFLWKKGIVDGTKKDITIEQQDDVIGNHDVYDQNKSEDRVEVEDEARDSDKRESDAAQQLIESQARALAKMEKENAELKKYAAENTECLRTPWPEQLQVTGGRTIRGTGKNGNPDPE